MSTTTLRLDPPLKQRFAHLAEAMGQTAHGLMLNALGQKADEMEAQLAFSRLASARYQAIEAGQAVVEWDDMKRSLRERVQSASLKNAPVKKSTKARVHAK